MQFCFFVSQPFITTPNSGPTRQSTTFQAEERLALMITRANFRPTGTRLSTRFASVWGSAKIPTSLLSKRPPALCTHWSLMDNTAPPHWVETRGSRWLAQRPPCSQSVTRKDSMQLVRTTHIPEQESVSLQTKKIIATTVIPELALAQEGTMITPTLVGTKQRILQITAPNILKGWGTS